jgi:hypothetical protein
MAFKPEDVMLEPEQEQLLAALVEARRNVPRETGLDFLFSESMDGGVIIHDGFQGTTNYPACRGDLDALANEGLISVLSGDRYGFRFAIAPQGVKYYEYIKAKAGQPIERTEDYVRTYNDAEDFQLRHPQSYELWSRAETLLWKADTDKEITNIGHICREASQAFATELVNYYQPADVDKDLARVKNRMLAVIELRKDRLGEREVQLLEALTSYWNSVIDLIQRQEHGKQRQSQELTWEDARRVVFQTAVAMFEIDRSMTRTTD